MSTDLKAPLVATQEGELWLMVPPDAEALCCVAGTGWLSVEQCARCEQHRGRVGVFGQGVAYKCGWLRGQKGLYGNSGD